MVGRCRGTPTSSSRTTLEAGRPLSRRLTTAADRVRSTLVAVADQQDKRRYPWSGQWRSHLMVARCGSHPQQGKPPGEPERLAVVRRCSD